MSSQMEQNIRRKSILYARDMMHSASSLPSPGKMSSSQSPTVPSDSVSSLEKELVYTVDSLSFLAIAHTQILTLSSPAINAPAPADSSASLSRSLSSPGPDSSSNSDLDPSASSVIVQLKEYISQQESHRASLPSSSPSTLSPAETSSSGTLSVSLNMQLSAAAFASVTSILSDFTALLQYYSNVTQVLTNVLHALHTFSILPSVTHALSSAPLGAGGEEIGAPSNVLPPASLSVSSQSYSRSLPTDGTSHLLSSGVDSPPHLVSSISDFISLSSDDLILPPSASSADLSAPFSPSASGSPADGKFQISTSDGPLESGPDAVVGSDKWLSEHHIQLSLLSHRLLSLLHLHSSNPTVVHWCLRVIGVYMGCVQYNYKFLQAMQTAMCRCWDLYSCTETKSWSQQHQNVVRRLILTQIHLVKTQQMSRAAPLSMTQPGLIFSPELWKCLVRQLGIHPYPTVAKYSAHLIALLAQFATRDAEQFLAITGSSGAIPALIGLCKYYCHTPHHHHGHGHGHESGSASSEEETALLEGEEIQFDVLDIDSDENEYNSLDHESDDSSDDEDDEEQQDVSPDKESDPAHDSPTDADGHTGAGSELQKRTRAAKAERLMCISVVIHSLRTLALMGETNQSFRDLLLQCGVVDACVEVMKAFPLLNWNAHQHYHSYSHRHHSRMPNVGAPSHVPAPKPTPSSSSSSKHSKGSNSLSLLGSSTMSAQRRVHVSLPTKADSIITQLALVIIGCISKDMGDRQLSTSCLFEYHRPIKNIDEELTRKDSVSYIPSHMKPGVDGSGASRNDKDTQQLNGERDGTVLRHVHSAKLLSVIGLVSKRFYYSLPVHQLVAQCLLHFSQIPSVYPSSSDIKSSPDPSSFSGSGAQGNIASHGRGKNKSFEELLRVFHHGMVLDGVPILLHIIRTFRLDYRIVNLTTHILYIYSNPRLHHPFYIYHMIYQSMPASIIHLIHIHGKTANNNSSNLTVPSASPTAAGAGLSSSPPASNYAFPIPSPPSAPHVRPRAASLTAPQMPSATAGGNMGAGGGSHSRNASTSSVASYSPRASSFYVLSRQLAMSFSSCPAHDHIQFLHQWSMLHWGMERGH